MRNKALLSSQKFPVVPILSCDYNFISSHKGNSLQTFVKIIYLLLPKFYCPEKAMAPHSSTLAWKISWVEEPGRLQSMGSLRVRHDWATSLSCSGEGNGNPLQCSCLENPRDGRAWWAAIYGVAHWTRLKRLSSSSSKFYCLYVHL